MANVRDGWAPQTNIVRQDGRRGALVTVRKAGTASTIDVVKGIRQLLPRVAQTLPPALKIQPLADQSLFVSAAVSGVIREAVIAACLTALMILLFLGSWRSTLIIAVSIPLSILTSVIVLGFLGETINTHDAWEGWLWQSAFSWTMRRLRLKTSSAISKKGMRSATAILEGAAQIAVPALVSTLCICIVFLPDVSPGRSLKFLFVPLAEAVIFALLASYVLSRTLVPTLAMYLFARRSLTADNLAIP